MGLCDPEEMQGRTFYAVYLFTHVNFSACMKIEFFVSGRLQVDFTDPSCDNAIFISSNEIATLNGVEPTIGDRDDGFELFLSSCIAPSVLPISAPSTSPIIVAPSSSPSSIQSSTPSAVPISLPSSIPTTSPS